MYKDLKEYCEGQYKAVVEMDKKKQACPKCGKKTFCLWGDNLERGTCFHTSCGLRLNLNTINYGIDYKIIMYERLLEASKVKLFIKDEQGRHQPAYIYATEERKISDLILKRSDVGVMPSDYDFEKETEDLFTELNQKIEEETDESKKEKLQTSLSNLTEQKEKIKSFIGNNYQRLAFFYRDTKGRITQIKTRISYAKGFQTHKIRENVGVFNYDLFFENEINSKNNSKKLLIFEGEFNQLRFATLAMTNTCPFQSCALGGAQGADLETALKLTSGNVCIVYDNDDAGKSVLDRAKEIRSIYGITMPEPHNDIDEYINSFKEDKEAFCAVYKLINSAERYHREVGGIKKQVTAIMKYDKCVSLDKCQKVATIIINELSARGNFIQDNNFCYIFLADKRRVVPLLDNNEQIKTVLNLMGVNSAKDYFRYVMEELRTHCRTYGKKIETHNFAHYDAKNSVLYLFNGDKTVYKITTDTIEELENGDEGIMFNYNNEHEPFELVEFDKSKDYFKISILNLMNVECNTFALNSDDQKDMLRLWFFSTFFHSIMPSKIILAAIGEKGSGKTSTLRRLGIILFGEKYNVTPLPSKPEDFDTLITNNHFVILDNVDSGKSWLNDKLASVATGQTIQKRKLYTDNENIKLPAKTFLGVTSRTPQFTRDDVADRLICLSFKRIDKFIPENELISEVIENRNEIMSYIMLELQEIIKALKETKGRKYQTKFRIADFAVFGLKINDAKGLKSDFESLLDRVGTIQKDFAVEEDSLVYVLKILCALGPKAQEYSSFALYKRLLDIAKEDNYDIPEFKAKYKSVKSLTRRIGNIKGNIINDAIIKIRKGRSNTTWYTIELADKDFKLPPTQFDINTQAFDKIDDETQKEEKNEGEGDNDE